MPSDIYNFSRGCAEYLSSVEGGAEIFSRLVSAYYLTLNFPPGGRRAEQSDLRGAVYKNLEIVDKIMPEPTVRANFLCAAHSRETEDIIRRMLTLESRPFKGKPEVIGWMYQYFNQKRKNAVYKELRRNIKIAGASLAPATQIFTPKWIAGYLTENAIGRMRPGMPQGAGLRYYVRDARGRLDLSLKDYLGMKLIDPCMGCGHMLLGAFDVLMDVYAREGLDRSEAALRILTQNLYGLDVDATAVRIGRFALIMKAAAFDPYFLGKELEMNLFSFEACSPEELELGSLLEPRGDNGLLKTGAGKLLSQSYDIVVTNPPYMGNHNMSHVLSEFVKVNYPLSKTDLSTVFMERAFKLCKPCGAVAMINISSWLFLPTYEGFREYIIKNKTLLSLLDLGQGAFERGNISRTVAFVMANLHEDGYTSVFSKVYDRRDEQISEDKKESMFFDERRRYYYDTKGFMTIPKRIFAYSLSDEMRDIMNNAPALSSLGKPRQGLKTGDNARFIRLWHEVPRREICFDAGSREEACARGYKWFPYNKAGEYRRWYGNNRYIVNWENDGAEIRGFKNANGRIRSRPQNMDYFFKSSISWNMISSGMAARYIPEGFIFDGAGGGIFSAHNLYLLGYLNSRVAESFLEVTSQSINYNVGQIADLPVVFSKARYDEVVSLVSQCIELSKQDWDDCEESWDFTEHPMVRAGREGGCGDLAKCYAGYEKTRDERYLSLKRTEERLDIVFAEIFTLSDFKLEDARPTVKRADKKDTIKRLISFAVGCMLGRLDCAGFKKVDRVGIVSSADLFEEFLKAAFGGERVKDNMSFVASALGKCAAGEAKDVIREYFRKDFLREHEKNYLKRPIYALSPNHAGTIIYK